MHYLYKLSQRIYFSYINIVAHRLARFSLCILIYFVSQRTTSLNSKIMVRKIKKKGLNALKYFTNTHKFQSLKLFYKHNIPILNSKFEWQ